MKKEKIYELYSSGKSVSDISGALGISKSYVYRVISEREKRKTMSGIPREKKEKIIEMYANGVPMSEIEKNLKISKPTVYRTIDYSGIERRYSGVELCPFFVRKEKNKLTCESFIYSKYMILNFKNVDGLKKHRKKFCCSQYKSCYIYQLINKKYEEKQDG